MHDLVFLTELQRNFGQGVERLGALLPCLGRAGRQIGGFAQQCQSFAASYLIGLVDKLVQRRGLEMEHTDERRLGLRLYLLKQLPGRCVPSGIPGRGPEDADDFTGEQSAFIRCCNLGDDRTQASDTPGYLLLRGIAPQQPQRFEIDCSCHGGFPRAAMVDGESSQFHRLLPLSA